MNDIASKLVNLNIDSETALTISNQYFQYMYTNSIMMFICLLPVVCAISYLIIYCIKQMKD